MWPKSKIVQLLWFSQGKNKVSNVLYCSIHIVFVYFQRWEQNSWESVGRMSWMSFTLSSGTEKRNLQQLTKVVWVLKSIFRQYSQQYYLFSFRYVIMIIYLFFRGVMNHVLWTVKSMIHDMCGTVYSVSGEWERWYFSFLFYYFVPKSCLNFSVSFLLLTLCNITLLQWFGNLFLMLKPCCTTLEILLPLETSKIASDNTVIVRS